MAAVRSIIEATEDATELYVTNVWTAFDTVAEPLVLTVAAISLAVLGSFAGPSSSRSCSICLPSTPSCIR